jgi:hypothetical protein
MFPLTEFIGSNNPEEKCRHHYGSDMGIVPQTVTWTST